MMFNKSQYKYSRGIRIWLWIGLIMLVGQVVLGGITRLTGSGLSITSWDIITGVIPPLNSVEWQEAFDLYKATPQFNKLNSTFELEDFKFIYFWEYLHRLWVRSLGIIFLIPFIWFVVRKRIDLYLVKRLSVVVLLTALTASAGWIMVMSGLIDRPWVDAYKLTIHFMLAILVIWAMLRTVSDTYSLGSKKRIKGKNWLDLLLGITMVQLVLAGLMAGMKAGLYYPTWPDMNGELIPGVLLNSDHWTFTNMADYDGYIFAPALVQFLHRMVAYLLVFMTFYGVFKYRQNLLRSSKKWIDMSLLFVIVQVVLGILTVLNVNGKIPLVYGVAHQLFGLIYFMVLVTLRYSMRFKN